MIFSRMRRSSQSGAALILVLWTFTVLSALAAEFARAMREDAQSTSNFKQETIAHYAAIAGINEALMAILTYNGEVDSEDAADGLGEGLGAADSGDDDPEAQSKQLIRSLLEGRGDWVEATFEGVPYELRVFDESGKIPLNSTRVDEEVLRTVLTNLGYDETVAATVSDSILDWRDEDDLHRPDGAEDDYYEGLDRPYHSKDAPFSAVEELQLVRGVTPEMYHGTDDVPGLKDIFSAISRSRQMTLHAISPAVERALCGDEETEKKGDGGLGRRDVDEDSGVAACLAATNLGSRSGERAGKATIGTATIEARVKDPEGRVLTHIGTAVHFRGDGFRTLQWYDAMFSDEG